VLSRGDDVVPIPGTKRVSYLEENWGATDVRLSDAELERREAELPPDCADSGSLAGAQRAPRPA
jgi:aryl-alcohol dehydrogenase-like predicted oxidoreductase